MKAMRLKNVKKYIMGIFLITLITVSQTLVMAATNKVTCTCSKCWGKVPRAPHYEYGSGLIDFGSEAYFNNHYKGNGKKGGAAKNKYVKQTWIYIKEGKWSKKVWSKKLGKQSGKTITRSHISINALNNPLVGQTYKHSWIYR